MNKIKSIKKDKSNSKTPSKVEKIPANINTSDANEQLSAIRDLLFGEQLLRLEQDIQQQNAMLNERLDNLESLITKTSEEFNKKLSATNHDMAENLESHHLEHISQESVLEDKLTTLDKNFDEFQHETEKGFNQTHDTLTNTAKEIHTSLKQEVKRLTDKIETAAEELSAKKADRKAIANLLESMASNLTQSKA